MENVRERVAGLDSAFGRRVRDQRQRQGVAQEGVATAMQLMHGFAWHQTTVAKTESGDRPVKLAEAAALAAVLGVPLVDLLYDDPVTQAEDRDAAARRELDALDAHVADRRRRLRVEGEGRGEHQQEV